MVLNCLNISATVSAKNGLRQPIERAEHALVGAKKNLAKLTYAPLFLGALKSNAMTQNVNRKEVEMALLKWFTGARDRGGERAARAPREKGASTTQTP